METDNDNHTPLQQRDATLAYAANGRTPETQATSPLLLPPSEQSLIIENAIAAATSTQSLAPNNTCQQCLTLSFYFDGTGNNMDADTGTFQQSNVAKLFQTRLDDLPDLGRFSFYIPGLGTYFKEIGDEGHTVRGLAMGAMGQERLDWAFAQFDKTLKSAEARAQNPSNKIRAISVNVFGFSRGATAARAFVRDLMLRCDTTPMGSVLKQGRYPIEVSFMGLFDTVASVGLPMSANNTSLASSAGLYSLKTTLSLRAKRLIDLAFGDPGADPAPGTFDGHASWADGLAVPAPELVKQCVHMVAGHEMRNSFPVDSVLIGGHYPENTLEMVYPGVHSDVGGGYQPNEGGRSPDPGDMLSLIPLRVMHQMAREAGVPLMDTQTISTYTIRPNLPIAFALDDKGKTQYETLLKHFDAYIKVIDSGGRDVGANLLNHRKWYLRWKMQSTHQSIQDRLSGGSPEKEQYIGQSEREFSRSREALSKEVQTLKNEWLRSQRQLQTLQQKQQADQLQQARVGMPSNAGLEAQVTAAQELERTKRDVYLTEKAKLDSYADDSKLVANMQAYDEQLIQDAKTLIEHHQRNPHLTLRPHYQNLVDAYLDEFERGKGLRDETIIAFFDNYVHDSLSGFATDATLPSDPRVVYIGGDKKLEYAKAKQQYSEKAA